MFSIDGKRRGKVSRLLPIGRQKALHDGAIFVLINAFFRVDGRKSEPIGLHCAAHRFGNMIGGSGFRMADIDRKPDEAVLHPQKSHIHRQRPAIGRGHGNAQLFTIHAAAKQRPICRGRTAVRRLWFRHKADNASYLPRGPRPDGQGSR